MKSMECPPDWCDACGRQSTRLHCCGLERLCPECERDAHENDDWRDLRLEKEESHAEDR